ncbi:MAG: hypothetical protein VKK98_06300 [Cyanobacteriota bacterium]|nr:hypothetical protein [Cyanobacteriota bacterium]
MDHPSDRPNLWTLSEERRRHLLESCWQRECDLDPIILRARWLRHQGNRLQAAAVEQELLPLI